MVAIRMVTAFRLRDKNLIVVNQVTNVVQEGLYSGTISLNFALIFSIS